MDNKKNSIALKYFLNPAQRKAVETIEGPVMVIAGPGTGKTQTLTARITHILKTTDTSPDGILALTFTDAGAREMRERLIKMIGPTAYYVNISTFHAFCSEVITMHPDSFPFAANLEPLSEFERFSIFREIIDSGKFTAVKPSGAPYLYVPSLIKAVGSLKQEGIEPKRFKALLNTSVVARSQFAPSLPNGGNLIKTDSHSRKISLTMTFKINNKDHSNHFLFRNQELTTIYKTYQQELAKRARYDFEDMINLVRDAFHHNKELLLDYQERFLYFLVDEYQDTNSAQNDLLMLLSSYWGRDANIFVVGDDEQSIFRFQGASIENLLSFRDAFPGAKIISLTENYRSTQLILNATRAVVSNNKLSLQSKIPSIERHLVAHHVIARNPKFLKRRRGNLTKTDRHGRKTGLAMTYAVDPIRIGIFSSGTAEHFFIAKKIQGLITGGMSPNEIAVIFRNNADGVQIAEFLHKLDITFDLETGKNILYDPTINKLLILMRAVLMVRFGQESLDLFILLNFPFFDCDYVDALQLARAASEKKITLWEAMNRNTLQTIDLKYPDRITHIYDLLAELQRDDAQGPFIIFFEKLLNKSGFLHWCLSSHDSVEKVNRLNSLFSEIKRMNASDHSLNLASFLKKIELMKQEKLAIKEEDIDAQSNAVSLLTAHRAKGKEFSVVFLAHATDKKWGNNFKRELIKLPEGILKKTNISEKEKNEDERRIFYVAMTRAKQKIYITSAKTYPTQDSQRETGPTMFLYEIPKQFLETIDTVTYEKDAKTILEKFMSPTPHPFTGTREKDFLKTVLADFKLSPTALNTYLSCPYKFKLNNLLRSPRAKNSVLSFGTAIHSALQHFFEAYKSKQKLPSIELLKKRFQETLEREIISAVENKNLLERGHAVLLQYVQHYKDELTPPLYTEWFFGSGHSKTFLEDIPLSGKVDKIEFLEQNNKQKTKNDVRVVDYKTGQPKSRSDIEGTLKNSTGDYKRQLVFYQLLGELDKKFEYVISETELDFVEPDRKKGTFHKERFVITKEEVEDLKNTIRKVWADILALKFPRTTTTALHCPRCEWKMHCWPEGIPKQN